MTRQAEVRKRFWSFAGKARAEKFWAALVKTSPSTYETRYWQEQAIQSFLDANPDLHLERLDVLHAIADETRYQYACPTQACAFVVICINRRPVVLERSRWGCGECGTLWRGFHRLQQAIAFAAERFPHRARCYTRCDGLFVPTPVSSWDPDYAAKCQGECAT